MAVCADDYDLVFVIRIHNESCFLAVSLLLTDIAAPVSGIYSTSVFFRYNSLVGSPLFGMFTQLSVIFLALFALLMFVGVVKLFVFCMNLSVLVC